MFMHAPLQGSEVKQLALKVGTFVPPRRANAYSPEHGLIQLRKGVLGVLKAGIDAFHFQQLCIPSHLTLTFSHEASMLCVQLATQGHSPLVLR